MTKEEFEKTHCPCGSQRCPGAFDKEWAEGCPEYRKLVLGIEDKPFEIPRNIVIDTMRKDLSGSEYQGRFGHDKIDELTQPGFYILPFRTYNPDGKRNIPVQVLSVFSHEGAQCIVVYSGDFMWVFYYNGNEQCFKPNFEPQKYETVLDWIDLDNENNDD